MKFQLTIFALLITSAMAFGDVEYYLGDSMTFTQSQAEPKNLPSGAVPIPRGRVMAGYIGCRPEKISIRISDSVSTIPDFERVVELKDELNTAFQRGDLINLPSGQKVQLFKGIGNDPDRLVTYNSHQLLIGITDLIKKKSDQGAPGQPPPAALSKRKQTHWDLDRPLSFSLKVDGYRTQESANSQSLPILPYQQSFLLLPVPVKLSVPHAPNGLPNGTEKPEF